jgi:RNA-directed DNA polymerase
VVKAVLRNVLEPIFERDFAAHSYGFRPGKSAQQALETITKWVQETGLQLHPTKTRIVDAAEKGGFDFMGYHFERYSNSSGRKWPRKKSVVKLHEAIREKTGRLRSGSLETIIAEINPTLKGWYAYFKESMPKSLEDMDGWVRQRLRSLVRRRKKRQGISKGREDVEMPNQWFAERGLFSMAKAAAQRTAITS